MSPEALFTWSNATIALIVTSTGPKRPTTDGVLMAGEKGNVIHADGTRDMLRSNKAENPPLARIYLVRSRGRRVSETHGQRSGGFGNGDNRGLDTTTGAQFLERQSSKHDES
jgi:hypothetical protein